MAETVAEASEAAAEEVRRQERQATVEPLLTAKYGAAGAMYEPQAVRADLARGIEAGLFTVVPEGGPDDNFAEGRIEAAPGREALLEQMRTALVDFVDDPLAITARDLANGVDGLTAAQLAAPAGVVVTGARRPTLEEATNARMELVHEGVYRLGNEPDGMYGLRRVEGTTPETVREIEEDREAMRQLEFARRYQDLHAQLTAAGADRQTVMRDAIERGIRDGEYTLVDRTRRVAGLPGSPTPGPRTITYQEVVPAGNAENRELAGQYAQAFNTLLSDNTLFSNRDRIALQTRVAAEVAPNLADMVREGTEAQRTGLEQLRRQREAREALGLHPARQRYLDEIVQGDRDREGGRLTNAQAWDEVMRTDSEFRAATNASQNRDPAILARAADLRAQLAAGPADLATRRAIEGELENIAKEGLELGGYAMGRPEGRRASEWQDKGEPTGAAAERRRRNEEIAKNPGRFGDLDIGQEEGRRRAFIAEMRFGTGYGDFYGATGDGLNPSTFQYEGPYWEGMSRLEREACAPLTKEAHQAFLDGRLEDEQRLLEQAADAKEKAFGEVLRARSQITETVTDVRTQMARRVSEHQEGTFVVGRTTDRELNMELVNEVLEQFNMPPAPSATYRHRGDRPLTRKGEPRRGSRGDIVATDLIYRAPEFPNVAFVARFNVDGQLVSAEVHVTKDTVLKQAHGLGRRGSGMDPATGTFRGSGRFTDQPSQELMKILDARFQEVKGSVSDPEDADRRVGSNASLGDGFAGRGDASESDSYGPGYRVPREGGLWALQTIQAGLVRDGLPAESADRVTHRRVERPRPGQPRRWWWLRATSRDFDRDGFIQRRGQ